MTVHQFFCILHFCHTCYLCRVELVVQFPARGSTQVLCLFPGVLWLWHFLYSVGPHPVSSLLIYTFVVSRAFMASAASQAGDADSPRAPGLTSGLQGSVNVHRGALLLVPQWQCISSFVFYICKEWVIYGQKSQILTVLSLLQNSRFYIYWKRNITNGHMDTWTIYTYCDRRRFFVIKTNLKPMGFCKWAVAMATKLPFWQSHHIGLI